MALTKVDDRGLKTPIDLLDNEKIRLGTGNDLELYHDGSNGNSHIKESGSGSLVLNADDLYLQNAAGTENLAVFKEDGAVELYHDNTLRFLTNSIGAQCQGDFSIPLDNEELRIGAGNDFKVKHDGTNTIMSNNTGALYISGDDIRLTNAATDENYIKGVANGAVQLYYDNSKKWETTSLGTQTFGDAQFEGNDGTDNQLKWDKSDDSLYFRDSVKAQFGTGGDLKLYHSGSHSYIKHTGTGNFYIDVNTDDYFQVTGEESETLLSAQHNGAVELFHNGSKKFHTYSEGCSVFGNLNLNDSTAASVGRLRLGDSSDLLIYHDGSNSYIDETKNSNNLWIRGQANIYIGSGSEKMATFSPNGSVQLYYDDSKKFETTSTGIETAEIVKMKDGSNGVNIRSVHEAGVGNTASTTATVPSCVGGGTVTVTCMHNGNTSITTTKMFPIMIQGTGTPTLGSEIFSINALTEASMSVSAASQGVTVTNNCGNHAKIRVTFDITANA